MWKEAEKKLKKGIEAEMHFYCKDKEICTRFICDLDTKKKEKRGGGCVIKPSKVKRKGGTFPVEELSDEKTRFKKKKMMLDRKEERLEKEQELLDVRAVQQTKESRRLSDGVNALNKEKKKVSEGVNALNKEKKKVWEVGVEQKHQQDELERGAAALAQKEVDLERSFAKKEEELESKELELTRKFGNLELELTRNMESREFALKRNLLVLRNCEKIERCPSLSPLPSPENPPSRNLREN